MDDERSIAQVLGGDRDAFRELVERYRRPLVGLIRSIVGQNGEVDDIAQETFLAAYRHLDSYDARRGAFATWLLTIARRQCLNALERRRLSVGEPPREPLDSRTPADYASANELMTALDDGLVELPEAQRSAFVLSEIHELPHAEIAAIEGIEVGTVKSRLARAKERLRSILARWQAADAAPPQPNSTRPAPSRQIAASSPRSTNLDPPQ